MEIADQLVLPVIGWIAPEPRARLRPSLTPAPTRDDEQISVAIWLFAMFHESEAAQFTIIPTSLLVAIERAVLTATAHRLLLAIAHDIYQFRKDEGRPKRIAWGRLGWMTSLGRTAIFRGQRELEDRNCIKVHRRRSRQVNTFSINPPDQWLPKPRKANSSSYTRVARSQRSIALFTLPNEEPVLREPTAKLLRSLFQHPFVVSLVVLVCSLGSHRCT